MYDVDGACGGVPKDHGMPTAMRYNCSDVPSGLFGGKAAMRKPLSRERTKIRPLSGSESGVVKVTSAMTACEKRPELLVTARSGSSKLTPAVRRTFDAKV